MCGLRRRLFADLFLLGMSVCVFGGCGNSGTNPTPTLPPPATATIVPPTIVPPTQAPSATPRYRESDLIKDSWVADAPELRVRFFAPPSLIEMPGKSHTETSFVLFSPSDSYNFESLSIFRLRGHRGGETDVTWKGELDATLRLLGATDYSLTFGPSPQLIGPFLGQRGQFNYAQASNGLRLSGTMWVGQVGEDVVEIVYRAEPPREAMVDRAMAQIMATIDFDAVPRPIPVPTAAAPPAAISPTATPPIAPPTATPRPTATAVPLPTSTPAPREKAGSGLTCPPGYPVKGNDNSGIYHVPGQRFYDATNARRCFITEQDAINAGFRRSQV